MIWDYAVKGMSAAAWIVGFLMVLGLMAGVLYLFCVLMRYVFGEDDELDEADRGPDDIGGRGDAGAVADIDDPRAGGYEPRP